MKLEELCKELCGGLAMRAVPIGYAIKTPFVGPDGDAIGMYVRRQPGAPGLVRFEDDGGTIASLEMDGVNFSTDSRTEALADLLNQYGASFDEEQVVLHTDYVSEERAAANFAKFMALLLRVQDLRLLSREKVARAFRDDVKEFLQEHFLGRVMIEEETNPSEDLPDYVADFVLRGAEGTQLAIYAASTENKGLEALLLQAEVAKQSISNIKTMTIFEAGKPHALRAKTMSRLMNNGVLMGSLEGTRSDLARRISAELGIRVQ